MSKITTVEKIHKQDNAHKEVACFEKIKTDPGKGAGVAVDVRPEIRGAINSAEYSVCIASTGSMDQDLLSELYLAIERGIRVYVILADFGDPSSPNDVLKCFDKKRAALIRECPELQNNWIVSDDRAWLLFQELDNLSSTTAVTCSSEQSIDLQFWFSHYFWEKASREQLLGTLSEPRPAPYPVKYEDRHGIQLLTAEHQATSGDILLIPRDQGWVQEAQGNERKQFVCEELQQPIRITSSKKHVVIGRIKMAAPDILDGIQLDWEYKHIELAQVSGEFLPLTDTDWYKSKQVIPRKAVPMGAIRAGSIREMDDVRPEIFPEQLYVRGVEFKWQVLPPVKPVNTKPARIYAQYDKLVKQFHTNLAQIESSVAAQERTIMKSKKDRKPGLQQGLSELKATCSSYAKIELRDLPWAELETLIKEKMPALLEKARQLLFPSQKKQSKNELEHLQKRPAEKLQLPQLRLPDYLLPESGDLYENADCYYLEIENYEQLDDAEKLLENRYIDKHGVVVAKGDNP